jgi:hypothetical protein
MSGIYTLRSTRSLMSSLLMLVAAAASRAELVFETKKISAEMSPGEAELVVRFPFANHGSKGITVTGLEPTCECTHAKVSKERFGPGESGEVTARFKPGGRHGLQVQGITVKTDLPEQPEELLILSVDIPEVMTLSRKLLLWREGELPATKAFEVTTMTGLAVSEVRAHAGGDHFRAVVERAGDSRFQVKVTPTSSAKNLSEALHVDVVLSGGQIKTSSLYVRVR